MYKKIEALSPEQFIIPLKKHLAALELVLKEKQMKVKHDQTGLIRIVKNHGSFQFYKRKSKRDAQGIYMPRAQNSLALKLIQNDYDTKAINSLHKEISLLKVFLKKYKINNTTHLFEKLSSSRRKLITPLTLPDERFAKNWLATEYKKKQIPEDAPKLFTDNGEQVRSKSEVIIANSLKAAGIPYRYEFPVSIKGLGMVYADFTILDIRERRELIIEHFGMMLDAEYSTRTYRKIDHYQNAGYTLDDDLLISFESERYVFQAKTFEAKIRDRLMPDGDFSIRN